MSSNSPLSQVKASSQGSKKELVSAVKALATDAFWINRMKADTSWDRLSNAKLLRLQKYLTEAKKRFGSRAELIEALAGAQGFGKDADYKKSLERHPLPRLMDALQSAERRAKRAAAKKPA